MLEGKLAVEADQPVEFTFTVTNADSEPVSVTFRDAGKADFVVYDGDEERWRWSDGKMFAQMIQEASLAPGEQTTFEATWDDPTPGTYTARAELRTHEPSCEAETSFSVE